MKIRLLVALAAFWLLAGYGLWVNADARPTATASAVNSLRPFNGHEFDDIFVNRAAKSDRLKVTPAQAQVAPYNGPYCWSAYCGPV